MQPPPTAPDPRLRQILEFGPLLVFLAAYFWFRDTVVTLGGVDYAGFIIAIVIFTPLQLAATLIMRRLTGKLSRMQVATLVLVVVLGGITVALNDERFFKMKSTFVFGIFSLLLWIGLARGRSYFAYVLEGALPISHDGWMILTRRLAWFFAAVAVANEVIWRNFSTDVYVLWDTLGQMGVMFGFFISNYRLIETHWQEPDET
ncbi:septation protein IspZ [Pararhodobacter sp. SW119]|uniref:inner membrane-spanning protein YciB n=1 Tax=Pararhodobacter sp. SW119 TaxID=2780075 RepID=UPI001ADEDF59|nr:septation protein IspZ [Pararhodobacter sp. SW119]